MTDLERALIDAAVHAGIIPAQAAPKRGRHVGPQSPANIELERHLRSCDLCASDEYLRMASGYEGPARHRADVVIEVAA